MIYRLSSQDQQYSLAYERLISRAGFYVVYHFFGLPSTASLADSEREGCRHTVLDWEPLNAARGAEIHMDQYRWDLTITSAGLSAARMAGRVPTECVDVMSEALMMTRGAVAGMIPLLPGSWHCDHQAMRRYGYAL